MNRLFFIPDIHGRLDLLNQLINKLIFDHGLSLVSGKDKLIFGGDYVDRGPESAGVLSTIKKLVTAYPDQVIALAGNHEWLMINACMKGVDPGSDLSDFQLWTWNGGGATRDSYPNSRVPDDEIRWLASLPLSHDEPGFFFSHAPVPTQSLRRRGGFGQKPEEGDPWTKQELIWTYFPDEGASACVLPDGIVGVCGHVHALRKGIFEPRFYPHYIFADAGCGCHPDAPLVAIEVRSREVISVGGKILK